MKRYRFVALVVCASAAALFPVRSVVAQTTFESTLDQFIEQGRRDWKIPGLSVTVVHNSKIVYMKGFGEREIGKRGDVNPDTRFGMMSTTKALTAMAVAMLVDEQKVRWDDPVVKYLPSFKMPNAFLTQEVTVRDTLRHNAGLGNADALMDRGDLSSAQILERVRFLEPAYSLRSKFIYQNVMFQAAGAIVERASGMSWASFVETRIFKPLGMSRSTATYKAAAALGDPNMSVAHFEIDGTVRPIPEVSADESVPAAGSAWSTAADVARWMQFMLSGGQVDGRRLVREATFAELLKPQTLIPNDEEFYPTTALTRPHWIGYSLGWFLQDYQGQFVAMHTGSLDGRTAIIGLVPDAGIGVYAFGNLDHAEFRHALMWKVIDLLTGAPDRDWNADTKALYDEAAAREKKRQAEAAAKRIAGTAPSHPPQSFAGTYVHPAWGEIVVGNDGDKLTLQFGTGPLRFASLDHWHYDTFRFRFGDGRGGDNLVRFVTDADGAVSTLYLNESDEMRFRRQR